MCGGRSVVQTAAITWIFPNGNIQIALSRSAFFFSSALATVKIFTVQRLNRSPEDTLLGDGHGKVGRS